MEQRSTTWAAVGLAALLCAGGIALAFSSGGYFAGVTGVAEAAAAAALAAWLLTAASPLAGWSAPLALAVGAFGAFALWTLLSSHWSHAPARALIEADRALLYTLAIALAGLAGSVPAVRRAAQAAIVGGFAVVAISGLITRLLPHVWPATAGMELERLSYPVGYWNAMGAIGALAAIGCLHLAADAGRHRVVRTLSAAALPLVAAATVLTFSRGAIAIGIVGALAVLALARTPGTVGALVATVPTSAVAVAVVLSSDTVVDAAPRPQGWVAVIVAVCAVAAGGSAWALHRWRPPLPRVNPRLAGGVVAAAVVVTLAGAVATGAAGSVIDRASSLTESTHVRETGDGRARLTQLSDNGRVAAWRVSLDEFSRAPLQGSGAGTFALTWVQDRPDIQELTDGHSLLFESLGELGLIGTGLLVLGIGALGWGAARRMRGRERPQAALALVVLGTWTLHACIDWDWEMPALTLPALCLVALMAGARTQPQPSRSAGSWVARVGAAVALVCLGLVGFGMALSQSRVDTAVAAVHAGRCDEAIRSAQAASDVNGQRPEPYQVLAACSARAGDPETALAQMRQALATDPDNWRLVYNVAVLRALSGKDPRPTMRQARQLNPNSWLLRIAARELRSQGTGPDAWRAAAAKANLLI